MCGIAGLLQPGGLDLATQALLPGMRDALAHRGPDGVGEWCDAPAGIWLGHRRLAVIDLSPAGAQPMASPGGRFVMTFNGEVYNYRELRAELEAGGAIAWRGASDTEVLLAAVERWGMAEALRRAAGMFALALWDRRDRTLHLARDRVGEKPLYYGWVGGDLVFASELTPFTGHPRWAGRVDRDSLASYFRFGYVPAPHAIYEGLAKVPAGAVVSFPAVAAEGAMPTPVPYWTLAATIDAARGTAPPGDAVEALEQVLRRAVSRQMVSDVPLGAFLSGGIDSSTVVALMQAQSATPVRTFSIGFTEREYDESPYAAAVARHLGTRHEALVVTPAEAMAAIPLLPRIYDEPFADSSQVPTYLVSRFARREVTVSLSGDGGDELFAGYNRYTWANNLWNAVRWLPAPARAPLAALLRSAGGRALAGHMAQAGAGGAIPQLADKVTKAADVMAARDFRELYLHLVSHWRDPDALVRGGAERPPGFEAAGPARDRTEQMMYWDTLTYLPDDILAKVDRAAMACALETRVPFLDPEVIAFAWSLPPQARQRGGQGKWLLRQVLHRHVPRALVERPKMGFGIPLGAWLRGPLRAWAEELLDPARLEREGYLDPALVQAHWKAHLEGTRDWHNRLWPVLMFQAWLAAQ